MKLGGIKFCPYCGCNVVNIARGFDDGAYECASCHEEFVVSKPDDWEEDPYLSGTSSESGD